MNKITYINRSEKCGFSIYRVFKPIIEHINKKSKCSNIIINNCDTKINHILANIIYIKKNKSHDSIYHITGALHYLSLVLPKDRTITTVHDFARLDNNQIRGIRKFLFKLLYVYPLYHNKYIVCISEFTKSRLMKYTKIKEKNIFVIPNSVKEEYRYYPKKFNINKPIILHVGTSWNKNLKRTIEALIGLDVHLRIIGPITSEIKHILNLYNVDYSNIYNLTDEEILKEYINCDIVNFPSLYEGFGMPIIEAQAIGRIVVTSNLEPMKSIGQDGAFYVDPKSVFSIRNTYEIILSAKKEREMKIKMGLKNVERFRATKIAQEYEHIYQQIEFNNEHCTYYSKFRP